MEKMIEKLYQMQVEEEQFLCRVVDREKRQRECDAYLMFSQTLPQFMRGQLTEYIDLCDERHKAELQAAYEYGFKTAIKLVLESLKD